MEKDHPAILDALKVQNAEIEKDITFLYYHLPQSALDFESKYDKLEMFGMTVI